ncbi:MAG: glycosyl hydrolase [Terriglobia bacterium]
MGARFLLVLIPMISLILAAGSCGGGAESSNPPPPAIGVTLSPGTLTIYQDGTTPASVDVTVTRPSGTTRSVDLSVVSAPPGVTPEIDSPGASTTGKVTFTAAPQSGAAGTYPVTIRASDGASTGSANLSLTVAIVARVRASLSSEWINTFMSTSFQPASWTDDFFINHPEATQTLDGLASQHINVQVLERDIPQKTRAMPTSAASWDFTYIDGILNPIFEAGDHNPLYQIAMGPAFMYNSNNPQLGFNDVTYQEFADYCANLVKYYNKDGFIDADGHTHVSKYASTWPITYWGIYNEPNINGFTAQEYVDMYNVVVPAMQAEDPNIKFVAVELSDWGDQPQQYMPAFVDNVRAPVDVLATHYYSSCNQQDSDQQVLDTIPTFVEHVNYIHSQLKSKPALANVPVWVTENNVNADWSSDGTSVCNGTPFVSDPRGSSAFFAAWRPLIFSRLSQAGARALHHWGFNADRQFGEVDGGTAQPYLSYWVDYWLARYFPSPERSDILELDVSDSTTVEILATLRASDNQYVVMIANHAVHASTDNNGPGDPRTVLLDVSALGSITSATQLTLDARTNPALPPTPQAITPAAQIEITLPGYGVTFLELK